MKSVDPSTLCIGWPAEPGRPCRVYGDMHGCKHPDGHVSRHHICACGAVAGAPPRRRGPKVPAAQRTEPTWDRLCGTLSGYGAHHKRGEHACVSCRAALAEYHREYVRARRAR